MVYVITSRAREVISKFPCLFSVKKGTSKRYLSISITIQSRLYEIHIVLSSNFEFVRRIVDLNYLRTSDKFIQRIVHFYPLDSASQASSYNAIFTLDKIYPLDSDLSTGQRFINFSYNRTLYFYFVFRLYRRATCLSVNITVWCFPPWNKVDLIY
jgi:hypothetical protein